MELSPDIIGFQEIRFVFEKHNKDIKKFHQIEELANLLREYQYVFQPGMTYIHRNINYFSHIDEGVAIFSKFPILEANFIKLSRNFSDKEDEHQRICLGVTVNTPSGIVNIFVTHMSLSESARKRNIVEILNFINKFSEPHILIGDFNEEPDSTIINFLEGKTELNGLKGHFKDAWKELSKNISEWTFTTLFEKPKKRIDFIFFKGNQLKMEEIFTINNTFLIQPSDHKGLFAKLNYKSIYK